MRLKALASSPTSSLVRTGTIAQPPAGARAMSLAIFVTISDRRRRPRYVVEGRDVARRFGDPTLEIGAVALELAARLLETSGHAVEGVGELADLVVGANRNDRPAARGRARNVTRHLRHDL